MYKFEKLEIYQMALTYTDMIYTLTEKNSLDLRRAI